MIDLAVAWDSEIPLKSLLNAGAGPDLVGSDNLTPLHQTGTWAKIGCVTLSKAVYADACELRHCGRLPVELYLQQVLETEEDEVKHLDDISEELTAPSCLPEL